MKLNSNLVRVLKIAIWLLAILGALLLIVFPLLTSILVKAGQMPLEYVKFLSYVEVAQVHLMRVLGVLWLFTLGSCFASFLNVVAWRVPRGRGINGSSKCPFCNNKLRFTDNLPVVGWLKNRGQCRDCRLPISPRYIIVEIILGFVFVLVCGFEILGGGANLPIRDLERLRGFEHLVFDPKWDLIQLTAFHLCLICLLFTMALIRSEGLKIPLSIFVTGLVLGVALPLIWPTILLVSWQLGNADLISMGRFSPDQFTTIAAGAAGGMLVGALFMWAHKPASDLLDQKSKVVQSAFISASLAAFILIGTYLGWQSAVSVGLITVALSFLNFNLDSRILVATLVHLLTWRLSTLIGYWPSQTSSMMTAGISVLLLIGLAIAHRQLKTSQKTSTTTEPQS